MSSVIVDRQSLILFARVEGFVDADRLLRIANAADAAALRLGDRLSLHGRLYDLNDAKVAPANAIEALCTMMADPRRAHLRANRVAYFGGSPLVQMQLRRLCATPNAGVFTDRRSAYAWAAGGRSIAA